MDRIYEAARRIAPMDTWRPALANAILDATDAVFVGIHTCPAGQRPLVNTSFAPLELESKAAALSMKILPRLERRYPEELWTRFGSRAFSLLDEIADTRFLTDIVREQRESDIEGVLCAFFRDQHGLTIGGITVATRQPGSEALAAFGSMLSEVAEAATQTLCSAIDLAVHCGAVAVPPSRLRISALSKREREIMQLVCSGFSDLNIAYRLGISENTVGAHLRRVYSKLSVHRRVDLAVFAAGLGMIAIEPESRTHLD